MTDTSLARHALQDTPLLERKVTAPARPAQIIRSEPEAVEPYVREHARPYARTGVTAVAEDPYVLGTRCSPAATCRTSPTPRVAALLAICRRCVWASPLG